MKLEKSESKLARYYERLQGGKASKIKPDHVDKVIRKLEEKRSRVSQERKETDRAAKRRRLKRKLGVIDDQIERARWLRDKIKDQEM